MKPKKYQYLLTVLLVVQILALKALSADNEWIERYYSNGIYPYISSFFRILFGWIPFSVGDLLFAIALLLFLRFIYLFLNTLKESWLYRLFQVTSYLSVLCFCFYFFWGLNYYRTSLASSLGYKKQQYSNDELIELTRHFIFELNKKQLSLTFSDSVEVVNPYTSRQMCKLARDGYSNLASAFPQFQYKYGYAKNSFMSTIQSYNGTSGYFNPFTGEAQVNSLIPKTSLPTTICHEMAHQIGFAAENEANFIGFLAALYNNDPYFQYAAYRMGLRYLIFELYQRDREAFKEEYSKLNKGIIKDFESSRQFWLQYQNPLEPIIKKGYNSYLKANKQAQGIESYNYVVDLLISHFRDKIKPEFSALWKLIARS